MGRWRKLSSRYVHENPFYKVREDTVMRPDDKEGMYYVTESGRSVFIVPVTDDGKVLFIKLFRYPTQMESWEIPAGAVEQGEDPLQAAQRELHEETGYTASQWERLGELQMDNSKGDSLGVVFICTGLSLTGDSHQTEEGIEATAAHSWEEVQTMVTQGELTDASTLAPLMLAFAAKKRTIQP